MARTPTTTVPTLSLAAERIPGPIRVAGFVLALLALDAVLAASLVDPRFSRLLLLFVGAGAAAAVFRFPLAVAIALLGFTDFVFHAGYFAFSVGPINARPYELALAGLFAVAVVRPRRETWGGLPGAALAIFLVVVVISGLLAVSSGRAPLTDVFNWGRALALLPLFYVVIRLFPSVDDRRTLLTGAAVLAATTGVVAGLVALGWGLGESLQAPGDQAIREQEGITGVQRVRLAGLSAAYALFWYSAVRMATARGTSRWMWIALLGGIGLNIAVSFNRNMWLGLALGLVLLIVVGGNFLRHRLAAGVAVAVTAAVLLVLLGPPAGENPILDPVLERGSTILSPSAVTQEGSYQARERETRVAWETITDNLALGVGAGADFGLFHDSRIGPNSFVRVPQLFLHNQYLYLLLIGGVPAFVAFLVFMGVPVARAFRRSPSDPLIAACGVGLTMVMVSALVALYFTVEDMTAIIGLLAGVIVADHDVRAAAGLDSGLAR
ncbi:MAG: O-antigen ligase family protein [Thermoleophilaceae bacterium]